eukprot:122259-Pelagomonas_calceolata.AAC.6
MTLCADVRIACGPAAWLWGFFAGALDTGAGATGWAVGADWACYEGGQAAPGQVVLGRTVPGQAMSALIHSPKRAACTTRVHSRNTFLNVKRHRVLKKQILRRWAATQGASTTPSGCCRVAPQCMKSATQSNASPLITTLSSPCRQECSSKQGAQFKRLTRSCWGGQLPYIAG